jgi:sortase B
MSVTTARQENRRRLASASRLYLKAAVCSFALAAVCLASSFSEWPKASANSTDLEPLQAAISGTEPTGSDLPAPSLATPAPSAASTASDAPDPTAPVPFSKTGLAPLFAQYPDLAGWLVIPGTVIDYPVVYAPEREDFYLAHNLDGEKDKNGTLLIQAGCDLARPGGNIIIHGHNMKSGLMFGDLDRYTEAAYYCEHPVIYFETQDGLGAYEIVAVFLSQVYNKSDQVFKYYRFYGADSEAVFDGFIRNIRSLALYETGVAACYGDQFLTLSTCAYHTETGRLVIVARRQSDAAASP